MKNSKVTPWEVEGKVDYGKLVREFGIKKIEKLPDVFEKNILFRRNNLISNY